MPYGELNFVVGAPTPYLAESEFICSKGAIYLTEGESICPLGQFNCRKAIPLHSSLALSGHLINISFIQYLCGSTGAVKAVTATLLEEFFLFFGGEFYGVNGIFLKALAGDRVVIFS